MAAPVGLDLGRNPRAPGIPGCSGPSSSSSFSSQRREEFGIWEDAPWIFPVFAGVAVPGNPSRIPCEHRDGLWGSSASLGCGTEAQLRAQPQGMGSTSQPLPGAAFPPNTSFLEMLIFQNRCQLLFAAEKRNKSLCWGQGTPGESAGLASLSQALPFSCSSGVPRAAPAEQGAVQGPHPVPLTLKSSPGIAAPSSPRGNEANGKILEK